MTPDEFRTIRKNLGLTQPQIAPLLGLNGKHGFRMVSNYETGWRPIPWHTAQLLKCYRILGVDNIPR